ncbi:MAG: salicylate hydroxylase [Planctomycetota bacterium]
MHALIIGGGIAGLCASIALRRAGIESTLFERSPRFTEVGAGISLWANALRALDHIGVGDSIRARGKPSAAGEVRREDGRVLLRVEYARFERDLDLPPTLWMLHRAELIEALAQHVPPATVRLGKRLVSVEQQHRAFSSNDHPGPVTAMFDDGSRATGDILIGADGIRSAVRAAVFGDSPPRYAGYTCWRGVATIPPELHPTDVLVEIWGRGQRFGITPLPGGRVYWFAVADAPAGDSSPDEHSEVSRLFRSWAPPVPQIIAQTPADAVIRNDIIDRVPARPWCREAVVLIGDAAHATTPNLGQGGCMAIEDAPILARCLKANGSTSAALEAFERLRFERTAAVTHGSWRMGRLAQGSSGFMRFARDWLTRLSPPRFAYRQMTGLARYDTGPVEA